jgi:hypothetical protein
MTPPQMSPQLFLGQFFDKVNATRELTATNLLTARIPAWSFHS